jgi:hypothetical protein
MNSSEHMRKSFCRLLNPKISSEGRKVAQSHGPRFEYRCGRPRVMSMTPTEIRKLIWPGPDEKFRPAFRATDLQFFGPLELPVPTGLAPQVFGRAESAL